MTDVPEVPDGPDAPKDLTEVQRHLQEIQRRKRGRIRWNISKDTAEMAIHAIDADRGERRDASSKSRRRKKKKRLL